MSETGRFRFFGDLTPRKAVARGGFLALAVSVLFLGVFCSLKAVRWIDSPFPGFLVNDRMIFGCVGQYHWTGTRAGLEYPDRILSANGRALSSPGELQRIVAAVAVGESIEYEVEKEGRIVPVSIPTMRFLFSDLLMVHGSWFIAGIVYLLIVVIVVLMKPDALLSWVFLMTFLPLSAYNLINIGRVSGHGGFTLWVGILGGFVPFAGIHLSLIFPEKKGLVLKRPWIQVIPYVAAAAVVFIVESSYPGPLFTRLQILYPVSVLVSVLCFLGSALHTLFRSPSTLSRQRAKVVLWGAALAFPVPVFLNSLSFIQGSTGKTTLFHNFLNLPTIICPASIAYAIAKHNLFDVDVYIKRAVGYGFMTALAGAGYLGVQTGIDSVLAGQVSDAFSRRLYPVVFALLVVLLFNPVNRKVQGAVDRVFYRKRFDYKETVIAVGNALSSVLNMQEIIRKILQTVRKEMFIDASGLILHDPGNPVSRGIFITDGARPGTEETRELPIPKEDPLLSLVKDRRSLITKYDIAEDPRYEPVRKPCGDRFAELGATIAVPLVFQDEVRAVLTVGQKKSGHFFSREDIELLETLASHGAVSIENAKRAEQMKKEEAVRTNLSRYLSPQIVDRIVKQDVRLNLGGDRREVTVLFSDIRNFTAITESRPPDQLVAILNEYFTAMAQIIFAHQGSLDKYIGDAIVAVFGSLIPLENAPESAVRAAADMMRRLPALNRGWMERYGFSMEIGIGVAAGEVFLGNVGSPERMEFTVIGDAVNVASRFSGLARGGQILVTRAVAARLGPEARCGELPPAAVKGKTAKMEVFEVPFAEDVRPGTT